MKFYLYVLLNNALENTKYGSHGVKNGVMGQIMKIPILYLVNTLEATFLAQSSRKLVKIISSMKSRTSSNLGHVGLKTRSQAQMSIFLDIIELQINKG